MCKVGFMHLHFPVELALAADAEPFRVLGKPQPYAIADAHLQSYACSLSRGALEQWLSGELDDLCCMVFIHACDTLQRLEALFRLTNNKPVFTAYFPLNRRSKASQKLLKTELIKLYKNICSATDTTNQTDETQLKALKEAATIVDKIRKTAHDLHKAHTKGFIDYHQLYTLLVQAQRSNPQEWLSEAAKVLNQPPKPEIIPEIPVAVYGGPVLTDEFSKLLSYVGARIVHELTSTGLMFFPQPEVYSEWTEALMQASNLDDAFNALAGRELTRPSDSTSLMSPTETEHRIEAFAKQAAQRGAKGVVFIYIKFCEPWGFEIPHMIDACKRNGLKLLVIDYEHSPALSQQIRTRVEAFVETLA